MIRRPPRSTLSSSSAASDVYKRQVHGRLFEIGEIDGHLRDVPRGQHHTHGFHVAEAAAGETDGLGDAFSNGDVGRIQIDVVGDQKLARAGDGGAGGRVADGVANVRIARRNGSHFAHQRLELAAADVLQVDAFAAARGSLVEVD